MGENAKRIINNVLFLTAIIAGAIFFCAKANAASLYISPSSGSYRVGETFQVGVFVSSADQAMNTAQATISFPTDRLEVISVSTKNSIFSLLVENPSFTNNAGNVNFSGIVLNPGYTGKNGRLVTINFLAKNVGQATVSITGGQVLANDGEGTSILSSRGSGTFTIMEKKAVEPPVEKPKPVMPVQPPITTITTTPPITIVTTTVTTTVNIITSTVCTTDHLPKIFLKINNLIFDESALSLLLLLLMIAISAAISAWAFVEAFIHENKHHFKKKK